MIIRLSKSDNRIVRWLQKALATDQDRPALNAIHVNGGLFACDGYRIHATRHVPRDLAKTGAPVVNLDKIGASQLLVDASPYTDYAYPAVHDIIPNKDPLLSVEVTTKYLRDALAMADGKDQQVRLVFYSATEGFEIMGKTSDDEPCYALVMPFNRPSGIPTPYNWRPSKPPTAEEPTGTT